ncbi:MAG: DUF86 domain-containing protein [Ignavibacteriales bacterium]|nr:DUF86 domain-containing protein [Ignavibacteriales bacterium]
MSKRDIALLLEDILESIEKIEDYTKNISFDDFKENGLVFDAAVRNLEIIGEASNKVSEESKNAMTSIPWKQIRGLRNRIIHEYFGVDINIVWFIIKNELPKLKIEIERAIKSK